MPNEKPSSLSPLSLAFVGDGVYSLMVREHLINRHIKPGELHKKSVELVNATAQAKAIRHILPQLTEEERTVYRRGRNAKVQIPKSATQADYHSATGLEALLGYLYLQNQKERLLEIFSLIIAAF